MDYTQGLGVEVVFDVAGGDFVNENLKALAVDGRMVSVAMQRGSKAEVDIFRIMAKRLTWTGSTLRPQSIAAKTEIAEQLLEKVWPLLASASDNTYQLKPNIFAEFALSECAKAHELMESGSHRGKLVLVI
jgi:NADPH2:quinone reductase